MWLRRLAWLVVLLGLFSPNNLVLVYAGSRSPLQQLQQQVRRPTQLFLPRQLVAGQANPFGVRGEPGATVVLLYAAQPAEVLPALPSGQTLPVPLDSPRLQVQLNDKGLGVLSLEAPADPDVVGRPVYLAAYTYTQSDQSDAQLVQLIASSGQPTNRPVLAIAAPSQQAKGPAFLPAIPGMDPTFMRQVGAISDLSRDDEKRERLWHDGSINRQTDLERNALYNGAGAAGALSPGAGF